MKDPTNDIRNRLILTQCRQGKSEGFDTLIETWEKPLFCFVRRFADRNEDAWDILQEVWVRAFRKIGSVRDGGALGAWLYKIARNAAVDHHRRTQVWDPLDDDEEQGPKFASTDDADLSRGFTVRELHDCMDQLPVEQREVLVLHFLEGYTHSEVADITGYSEGAVKARVFRAKKNLQRILEREDSSVERTER